MRASLIKDLVIWILALASAFVIFYFWNPLPKTIEPEISHELEEDLANRIFPLFEKQFELLEDSLANNAIRVILARLEPHVLPSEYEYKIHLVNDPEVNAFTFLDGHIVIFSGLLTFAESPEELAAVLAHEMGHTEGRHVLKKMAKELGLAILISATGGNQSLVTEILGTITSNSYDRTQEKEADIFALELLEKASINPAAMASFFRRINREKGKVSDDLEFLMTHPHNNSRIKSALLYETKEGFEEMPINVNWDAVQSGL